jgi:transmembrane protein EpsG
VSGIRAEDVGIDAANYYSGYERIAKGLETGWEPIYVWLNELAYVVYDAPEVAILFAALLTMLLYYIAFRYYSVNYALSLAIFLGAFGYFTSFNLVRQSIAIAVVTLAFVFLRSNRLIFIALLLIASGFHASAIIMLPMILFSKIKLDDRLVFTLIILWVFSVFFLLYPPLTHKFLNLLGSIIDNRYISYLTGGPEGPAITVRVLINQIFFAAGVYVMYFMKDETLEKEKYIIALSMLGIIAYNLTHHLYWVTRIAFYLYIFIVFSIPVIMNRLFSGWQWVIAAFVFYVFYYMNFLRAIANNSNGVNPYIIADFWKI